MMLLWSQGWEEVEEVCKFRERGRTFEEGD